MQELIQGLNSGTSTNGGPCWARSDYTTNSDASFPVCRRGISSNISSLGWTVRIPNSQNSYPLKRHSSRIDSYSLHDGPNEQDKHYVINDEKGDSWAAFPRMHIDYEKFNYAEVNEEHDDGDDQ